MQDAVQDSGGNSNVGKDLISLGEGLVGSEYGRYFLIPPGNELEEQVCTLNVHRETFLVVLSGNGLFYFPGMAGGGEDFGLAFAADRAGVSSAAVPSAGGQKTVSAGCQSWAQGVGVGPGEGEGPGLNRQSPG